MTGSNSKGESMKSLKEWLQSEEVRRIREMPISEYCEREFGRDPWRPLHYRPNMLLSPADGVILYSKEVEPDREVVSIKGKELTLKELLMDTNYNQKSIVVGIMMTAYDVHWNRMPSSGFIRFTRKDSLKIENLSMVKIEQALLRSEEPHTSDMEYLFYNERQVCEVRSPLLNQKYYIVQIADLEVNGIANLYESGSYLIQGSKFSFVCFGSQVDLIVPVLKGHKYRILIPEKGLWHVEAGIDPLIEVVSE